MLRRVYKSYVGREEPDVAKPSACRFFWTFLFRRRALFRPGCLNAPETPPDDPRSANLLAYSDNATSTQYTCEDFHFPTW